MSGIRRQGRELALKLIYSMQDRSDSVDAALEEFWGSFRFHDDPLGEAHDQNDVLLPPEVRRFTEHLVRGVSDHLEEIDETLRELSTNWSLDRMARVDLSLLRLAAFELIYTPDVPASVAINEAVEIGKRYGTKETPAFINGILDKIAHRARPELK